MTRMASEHIIHWSKCRWG